MTDHVTALDIDLNALHFNLNHFKSKLQNNTKIMAVVKAFGYGSDSLAVAKSIQDQVNYFAVAYSHEGIALRKAGIDIPILVLHPQIQNLGALVASNLEPNLYSKQLLEQFLILAKSTNLKEYPIHIKFNTGLNRLGFSLENLKYLKEQFLNNSNTKITTVFSHLAASEDVEEREFTLGQISKFKEICDAFNQEFGFMPEKHLCNTSGVLNYPNAHFDMVRIGIGLYGLTNAENPRLTLKNVLTLKSIISQIHQLNPGESIGYNRGLIAEKIMKIATIPIGHADGIPRILGNQKGFVSIHGKRAAIVGNVCMDMIMVDISEIECKEGDVVMVFNSQEELEELAAAAETISYEMLTAISQRVRRVIVS